MILLLGAEGYVGRAFAAALQQRRQSFVPLTRDGLDYTRFELLFDYVRNLRPEFLINAATYLDSGREVELVEKAERLRINLLLPQIVGRVCAMTKTPLAHVSLGSIYGGADSLQNNGTVMGPKHFAGLVSAYRERIARPGEQEQPNGSNHSGSRTFYAGTKALAEEVTTEQHQGYAWRLGLPFNEKDDAENFLSQVIGTYYGEGMSAARETTSIQAEKPSVQTRTSSVQARSAAAARWRKAEIQRPDSEPGIDVPTVVDGVNSLSQVDDCVRACLELWEARAAFGVYNMVNPGVVRTLEILEMMHRELRLPRRLHRVCCDQPPDAGGDHWSSRCILDIAKLQRAGIKLRPVKHALLQALRRWQPQPLL